MTAEAMNRTGLTSSGPRRCREFGHRNNRGEPCGAIAIKGTTGCRRHAGKTLASAKAKGAVVVELQRWGLDGHTDLRDPGETLLRLVTQSAVRCELYARLLGEAFEAAERLRSTHEAEALVMTPDPPERSGDDDMPPHPAVQAARADLRRIFSTGGVGALIGVKVDADRFGRIYAVEEGLRGLARLEADERDRCANFAAKAVAAGLAERAVRLAERQGVLMAAVFRGAVDDADLDEATRERVEAAFVRRLTLAADRPVLEGVLG
jgi:hypothetical protein